jgi:cell division protein ZapA (FtsZ GTPase activity inhibitor)
MATARDSAPRSIQIQLLGQKITLKTAETDPTLVQEVVDIVNAKIKEAEKRGKATAPHQVVLVALMDLAGEYARAKRRTASYKKKLADSSQRLIGMLESELK